MKVILLHSLFNVFLISTQCFGFEKLENSPSAELPIALNNISTAIEGANTFIPIKLEVGVKTALPLVKMTEPLDPNPSKISDLDNKKNIFFTPSVDGISRVGELDKPSDIENSNIDEVEGIKNSNNLSGPISDPLSKQIGGIGNTENLVKGLSSLYKMPGLAERSGILLPHNAKRDKEDLGLVNSNSKVTFGIDASDSTNVLNGLSQKTLPNNFSNSNEPNEQKLDLNNLKKDSIEKQKELYQKKQDVQKEVESITKLENPFTQKDYEGAKKLFQDEDKLKIVQELESVDPTFVKNANELFYGKEGERDFGLRDNDKEGKDPFENFLNEFKRKQKYDAIPKPKERSHTPTRHLEDEVH